MTKNVQATAYSMTVVGTGGTFNSWEPTGIPTGGWSLFSTVSGENSLSGSVNGGKTVSWDKPTLKGDGSAIPVSTLTGYKIYKNDSAERYAVASTWASGQSGLSDGVSSTTWKDSLAAPSGANTFDSDNTLGDINTHIGNMLAGDVMYLSDAGTANGGVFSWTGDNGLMVAAVSGTSDFDTGYITIMAVPGENPIVEGSYDGITVPVSDTGQIIMQVTGDYIRIYGLEVRRSNRFGIQLQGEAPHVRENYVQENYEAGIMSGYDGTNNGGIIEYNLVLRNSTAAGIRFRYDHVSESFNVDDWTIRRNISARNGYTAAGANIDPNGNADGFMVFKSFHTVYDPRISGGGNSSGNATGRWNAMQGLTIHQNIAYYNSDDGFDESMGRGLLLSNISMNNGPKGNRGYKTFTDEKGHFEQVDYVGNVAVHQNPIGSAATAVSVIDSPTTPGVARFVYTQALGYPVVTTSNKYEVSGFTESTYNMTDTNATSTDTESWFEVSTISYVADESGAGREFYLRRSSVGFETNANDKGSVPITATVIDSPTNPGVARYLFTQVSGFPDVSTYAPDAVEDFSNASGYKYGSQLTLDATDGSTYFEINSIAYTTDEVGGNFTITGPARDFTVPIAGAVTYLPQPAGISVNQTALHNDNNTQGAAWGIWSQTTTAGTATNNLNKGNDDFFVGPWSDDANFDNAEALDPGITDYTYKLIDETLLGAFGTVTVEQMWRHKYRQVMAKVMPTSGGNLHNLGTLDTTFIHAASADDPTAPSDPDDITKLQWYASDKTSAVPDIGASQYEYIQSPLNVSIA